MLGNCATQTTGSKLEAVTIPIPVHSRNLASGAARATLLSPHHRSSREIIVLPWARDILGISMHGHQSLPSQAISPEVIRCMDYEYSDLLAKNGNLVCISDTRSSHERTQRSRDQTEDGVCFNHVSRGACFTHSAVDTKEIPRVFEAIRRSC